jgi:hypothetical protein
MGGKRWSKEEEAILREIWNEPGLLKVQIERLPGRTPETALMHAGAMKLGMKCPPVSAVLEKTKALLAGGEIRTIKEIARLIGASVCQTRKVVMRAVQNKELAISRFEASSSNGNHEAYFRLGRGMNAKRPAPMTLPERSRKFRKTVDPIEYAFKKRQYNLNQRIRLGKLPQDELANALFGRSSA